ncbi:MAG: hypothetical protein KC421_08495 [Anaerolineales bacterium]|nr:hypothetical protein [Anaerolineales bacterium]
MNESSFQNPLYARIKKHQSMSVIFRQADEGIAGTNPTISSGSQGVVQRSILLPPSGHQLPHVASTSAPSAPTFIPPADAAQPEQALQANDPIAASVARRETAVPPSPPPTIQRQPVTSDASSDDPTWARLETIMQAHKARQAAAETAVERPVAGPATESVIESADSPSLPASDAIAPTPTQHTNQPPVVQTKPTETQSETPASVAPPAPTPAAPPTSAPATAADAVLNQPVAHQPQPVTVAPVPSDGEEMETAVPVSTPDARPPQTSPETTIQRLTEPKPASSSAPLPPKITSMDVPPRKDDVTDPVVQHMTDAAETTPPTATTTSPEPANDASTVAATADIANPVQQDEATTSLTTTDVTHSAQPTPAVPRVVDTPSPPLFSSSPTEANIQQAPLQSAWPVESSEQHEPAIISRMPEQPTPLPVPSQVEETDPLVHPETETDITIRNRLSDVPSEFPTDSAIPVMRPRKPRPQRVKKTQPSVSTPPEIRQKEESVQDEVPSVLPNEPELAVTAVQKTEIEHGATHDLPLVEEKGGETAVSLTSQPNNLVNTEIGALPDDLWYLIGETPPQDKDQQPVAVPAMPSQLAHADPQVIQREPDLETTAANAGPSESAVAAEPATPKTEEEIKELDLDNIITQVYTQIKQRLSIEWERRRGQF